MKIKFDTTEGAIEVNQEEKIAYFFALDYETTIAADGTFQDYNGREYRVLWPILRSQKIATLQVKEWRILGANLAKLQTRVVENSISQNDE